MTLERKSYACKADVQDEAEGIAHLVVSVFGTLPEEKDSDDDVMVKGAFAADLAAGKAQGKLPRGVWAHDWQTPIALTQDAWEEDDGLHVQAQFALWKEAGRDAFNDVRYGLIDEYSFGFKVRDAERKDGVRFIKDVAWYEWSPVLIGANRETRTVSVKAEEGLGGDPLAGLPFEDHLERALAAVGQVTERAKSIRDLRAKEGRSISTARRERLLQCADRARELHGELMALHLETEPPGEALDLLKATDAQVRDLFLRFTERHVIGARS